MMEANIPANHKFLDKADMTYKEVFDLVCNYVLIPLLQELAEEIGEEKFIEILKRATDKIWMERINEVRTEENLTRKDPETFSVISSALIERYAPGVWNAITQEVIENTDTVTEVKNTECLFARIFREANAEDFGYAILCHSDIVIAKAFHPNLKLTFDKTLMQGHDCCHGRYVWEE